LEFFFPCLGTFDKGFNGQFMSRILSLRSFSCVAFFLLAGGPMALAQTAGGGAADEAAVRQAGKDYLEARQRGDIKALADFWTADGTITDAAGKTNKIRESLAGGTGDNSADAPPAPIKVSNVAVRFVTPDVAVEDGECETATAGSSPTKDRYSAIWVRQNGHWKLNELHELGAAPPPVLKPLGSLDIFAGQWSGEINKSTVRVSAKWDTTKKFMRRDFSIESGNAALTGTQEIGWDAETNHIKSWSFFDDGSHGEALWSLEGNVWMAASTRVLPDGRMSTSTQVFKFPDKNTMIWKTIRATVDGEPADDFEVVLKRSPAIK
jgi:uncharacterized protein (TIGR02246 family)